MLVRSKSLAARFRHDVHVAVFVLEDDIIAPVRDIDSAYALELVKGDLDFRRRPDGTFMGIDEAVRLLRNRVNTRLFERLAVNLLDPEAGIVLRVAI